MIRKAKKSDFIGILKVFKEIHELHATNEPNIFKFTNSFNIEVFFKMLNNSNIVVLISENDKIINGFLIGYILYKKSYLTLPRKTFGIEQLAVLKKYQRKHIGKRLMSVAIKIAKKEKCDNIELNVWSFNKNALSFYKSLGFKEKSVNMQFDL